MSLHQIDECEDADGLHGAAEEETKNEVQQPASHPQHVNPSQQSIEQLYGQISMFDQITEENYYGRGEQSDDSQDEGEDANRRIKKFRQQIEHLNSDLHDLIYSGEDEESGEDDFDDVAQLQNKRKVTYKKMGSSKP